MTVLREWIMWNAGDSWMIEHYFIIRTPLESIRESADISNKFYFAVGLMIIILSGLIIMVVTRRITRPISELTELSRKNVRFGF